MNFKKSNEDEEKVIDLDAGEPVEAAGVTADDEAADDLDASIAKIAKLKTEIAACRAESKEYLDGWQRLKADVANMRKGDADRQKRGVQMAQEAILADLIPIIDSFDMARQGSGWQSIDTNWRTGVEAIISQLEQLIARYGAERIGAVGEAFDPRRHEAVSEAKADSPEQDGTVVAILRSGWKMGDAVLRPAQVTVAHA